MEIGISLVLCRNGLTSQQALNRLKRLWISTNCMGLAMVTNVVEVPAGHARRGENVAGYFPLCFDFFFAPSSSQQQPFGVTDW
jgi:hypothetical protein